MKGGFWYDFGLEIVLYDLLGEFALSYGGRMEKHRFLVGNGAENFSAKKLKIFDQNIGASGGSFVHFVFDKI